MTLSYDKILLRARRFAWATLLLTGACSFGAALVLTFREADDPTADALLIGSWRRFGPRCCQSYDRQALVCPVVPCAAAVRVRNRHLTAWRGEWLSAFSCWERRYRRRRGVPYRELPLGRRACLPAGNRSGALQRYVLNGHRSPVRCGHRKDGDLFRSRPTCSTHSTASTWMRAPRVRCG